MLEMYDDYEIVGKQQKRKKSNKPTSTLYEVTYTKHGLINVYDVYAHNVGEAMRKVKSKFGNVLISNTIEVA